MSGVISLDTLPSRLDTPLMPAAGGDQAIGFVGPDIPVEVLLASGRPFGHLSWEPGGKTAWADRWLESSFPFWARSILEQWHAGTFDALSAVVFSRGDDASQRLYYYVSELQRRSLLGGPRTHLFDIAYVERDSSARHTANAILALCDVLDVTPAALPAAIGRANRLREALLALDRSRTANGPLYERLGRLALWNDPTQWIHDVEQPRLAGGAVRVLLAGSVPPDDRLHVAVEATGAAVIAEAHTYGLTRLGRAVAQSGDSPAAQLAIHVRRASVGPRAMIDRAAWLVDRAATVRADAVILWLTREDEALAWQLPTQRRALAVAGLPALVVPAARWQADDGTLERIARFCLETLHATA